VFVSHQSRARSRRAAPTTPTRYAGNKFDWSTQSGAWKVPWNLPNKYLYPSETQPDAMQGTLMQAQWRQTENMQNFGDYGHKASERASAFGPRRPSFRSGPVRRRGVSRR